MEKGIKNDREQGIPYPGRLLFGRHFAGLGLPMDSLSPSSKHSFSCERFPVAMLALLFLTLAYFVSISREWSMV